MGVKAIFKGVIRSKGQIWLANAHGKGFDWHSAGRLFTLNPTEANFFARALEQELEVDVLGDFEDPDLLMKEIGKFFEPKDVDNVKSMISDGRWSKKFGDREQELVLIGVYLKKDQMKEALDAALLTDDELA